MYKTFFKYVLQSIAGMLGLSVYILADTFFISVCSGSDGLAVLNLMLPVYGVLFAIGSMVGIGSATRYRHQPRQGGEDGSLLLPVGCLECTVQPSFRSWRSVLSGSDSPASGSGCRTYRAGTALSAHHPDRCSVLYEQLQLHRFC